MSPRAGALRLAFARSGQAPRRSRGAAIEQELRDKVALVTGSGRNLGRSIALELAAAGAALIVNARSSRTEANAVVAEICQAAGQAIAILADVSNESAVSAMIDAAIQRFGRLDILVNNAAPERTEKPFEELTFQDWHAMLGSVLDGAFLCAKAALPHLRASKGAAIVNIGGLTGHTGAGHRAQVVTAKLGLVGLTRALAVDLAPHGITVNCIAPGMLDTIGPGPQPLHRAQRKTLVGRLGTPAEVAGAVRFLVGPNARFITGQTLHVNGGTYFG